MSKRALVSPGSWIGKNWRIDLVKDEVHISSREAREIIAQPFASELSVRHRYFLRYIYSGPNRLIRIPGIKKTEVKALIQAFHRLQFILQVEAAVSWMEKTIGFLEERRKIQRWISRDDIEALVEIRPKQQLMNSLRKAKSDFLYSARELDAVRFLDEGLEEFVHKLNEEIIEAEFISQKEFFDSIENSPLTEEQARAVICLDNRVQVLAAAGSGKTSIMVARAAYVVKRGFLRPEQILLLAFNRAVAKELERRIETSFTKAGIISTGIKATTFHSFGLEVIGKATKKKPRLARWLEHQGHDVVKIMEIVDSISDENPAFRQKWDMYRLLFAVAPTELESEAPDGYDKTSKSAVYKTFSGITVKSHGERLIADFMYLNGVDFEYEKNYPFPTANEVHSQYRPDFYYPDVDIWHEHWALDKNGNPPQKFHNYRQDMTWKRKTHKSNETKLVETSWGSVMFGSGLADLESKLKEQGLEFDWNPDRPVNNSYLKQTKHEDLAKLIRTFMSHVKSNSLTKVQIDKKLNFEQNMLNGFRTRLFLDIYWEIHSRWQDSLNKEDSVDFDDMIANAAEHLRREGAEFNYQMIMVDEFQDISQSRAQLVKGLLSEQNRYLLAVGDDWQSINRFAGSDISVMTSFPTIFGKGMQLKLTTTFRCKQTVSEVAQSFVKLNPEQFAKEMQSYDSSTDSSVTIIFEDDEKRGLRTVLNKLSSTASTSTLLNNSLQRISVDVLGRYGFQEELLPADLPDILDINFRTIHSSKGLEADYIIILGLVDGTYGFPSNIIDDPVLQLAMPIPEKYQHAEERRLLYVALTRARRDVAIITSLGKASPFVAELMKNPLVTSTTAEGDEVDVCSECGNGLMIQRNGPKGEFLACSRFPTCTFTKPIELATEKSKEMKHQP